MFKVSFDIFDVSVGRFDRKKVHRTFFYLEPHLLLELGRRKPRSTGPQRPISCLSSVGSTEKRSTGPFSMSNPISCLMSSVGANRGPQDLVRLISCLMRSALMQNSLRSFYFLKAKHEKSGSKATAINLNYVVLSIRLKLSLI